MRRPILTAGLRAGAFALAAWLAACAQPDGKPAEGAAETHDFERPISESLFLGQTTRQEVVKRYGKPTHELAHFFSAGADPAAAPPAGGAFEAIRLAGQHDTLNYVLRDGPGYGGRGGKVRLMVFTFFNERLTGYVAVSSDLAEGADDAEKSLKAARTLHRGSATRDDIFRLMGPPNGRAMFPDVRVAGQEKYLYVQFAKLGDGFSTQLIEFLVGPDTKLIDIHATSEVQRGPRTVWLPGA